MLIVLSPAKKLDFPVVPQDLDTTRPNFIPQSTELIEILRGFSPAKIAQLMKLSDKLANLNFDRFQAWQPRFNDKNSRAAAFLFRGDVYVGLDVDTLEKADLLWAQDHLRILSGLYGLLRPLDKVQPYRLEMGTRLNNPKGKDLYAYWGDSLAKAINDQLTTLGDQVLLNLASKEYFAALDNSTLSAQIVTPEFKDFSKGKYKIMGFYAKKARGLMARWVIQKRIEDVEQLKNFAVDGYRYSAADSRPDRPVFLRRLEG